MQKINGQTVRGGWSKKNVDGMVDGVKFSLWAVGEVNLNKVRYEVKKIEDKKRELPIAISNQNLYKLLEDNSVVAFK